MKKNPVVVLSAVFLVSLLAACASTPGPEQTGAAVEERTPSAPSTAQTRPAPPPPAVTTRPVQPPVSQSANPLKDPANILSKRSIYYELDSDAIREEYRPMMQAHARYLVEHRNAKVLLQGNADARGSREYNIALGQRRADGVKRMLMLLGATEVQVESVSLGEEKPRCSTDQSDACLAENRRSDVLYGGEY